MAASLLLDDSVYEPKQVENSLEDLLIFGYACKLFRNDERARSIDEGKHLIPWMGYETLMIDRYDGRGHLYDLSQYDADILDKQHEQLSKEEMAIEAACDEERYLELVTDVQEKAMYEEEEWKRYYESLQDGYQAVNFSYNENVESTDQTKEASASEEEIFVPADVLQVPDGMQVPETEKEHARIEKTAMFIAEHGVQMEVKIKTMQSRNTQFMFMNFEHPLNLYYQHLVQIIKQGKYCPKQDTADQPDSDQHYLHPSLSTTNVVTSLPAPPPPKAIVIPKVNVHETHYGQLISSLLKYSRPMNTESRTRSADSPKPASPRHGGQRSDHNGSISAQPHPSHTVTAPVERRRHQHSQPPSTALIGPMPRPPSPVQEQTRESRGISPEKQQTIVPPPPDIQPIIDRMAIYSSRNGAEFEYVVKRKKDPRFAFLEPGHVHYEYYEFKRRFFIKEAESRKEIADEDGEREDKAGGELKADSGGSEHQPPSEEGMDHERLEGEVEQDPKDIEADEGEPQKEEDEDTAAQTNRSICFSIKGRNKDSESVNSLKRPLFSNESSSDGEMEGGKRSSKKVTKSRIVTPDTITLAASAQGMPTPGNALSDPRDANQISIKQLERKQAEERLKDKIATAARDKIAATSKEKLLQAERKKKASMFVSLMRFSKESVSGDSDSTVKRMPESKGLTVTPGSSKASSPRTFTVDFSDRNGNKTIAHKSDGHNKGRCLHTRSDSGKHGKMRKRSQSPPSVTDDQNMQHRRQSHSCSKPSPIRSSLSHRFPPLDHRDNRASSLCQSNRSQHNDVTKRPASKSLSPDVVRKHKKRSHSRSPKTRKHEKHSEYSQDYGSTQSSSSVKKSDNKHRDKHRKKDKDKSEERGNKDDSRRHEYKTEKKKGKDKSEEGGNKDDSRRHERKTEKKKCKDKAEDRGNKDDSRRHERKTDKHGAVELTSGKLSRKRSSVLEGVASDATLKANNRIPDAIVTHGSDSGTAEEVSVEHLAETHRDSDMLTSSRSPSLAVCTFSPVPSHENPHKTRLGS